RHSLDPIFRPRSIAVLGASATPGSVGSILIRNLLSNPFGGVVYPVNPKRHAVHGVRCYPHLATLPPVVDLAVIATPALAAPPRPPPPPASGGWPARASSAAGRPASSSRPASASSVGRGAPWSRRSSRSPKGRCG